MHAAVAADTVNHCLSHAIPLQPVALQIGTGGHSPVMFLRLVLAAGLALALQHIHY